MREAGFEAFDAVAGGETAGIPFAAWMADRLGLPMLYVRKKPKGFGRNTQIEGNVTEGQRVLLVEDMTSDGGSKVTFCKALRDAGTTVDHVFVVFFYGIFPESRKILGDLGVTDLLATPKPHHQPAALGKRFDRGIDGALPNFGLQLVDGVWCAKGLGRRGFLLDPIALE